MLIACSHILYDDLPLAVNAVNLWYVTGEFFGFMLSPVPFEAVTCSAKVAGSCVNKLPLDLTVGVTLWHCLAYSLKPIDLIHHVPSLLVCALGIFYPWGTSLNAACFIFMGLPGRFPRTALAHTMVHTSSAERMPSESTWLGCSPEHARCLATRRRH